MDLPLPETPVTQTRQPKGNETVRSTQVIFPGSDNGEPTLGTRFWNAVAVIEKAFGKTLARGTGIRRVRGEVLTGQRFRVVFRSLESNPSQRLDRLADLRPARDR